MKNIVLNNPLFGVWEEASTIVEYGMALFTTLLFGIVVTGWCSLVVEILINPSVFDNVNFGLIDYL